MSHSSRGISSHQRTLVENFQAITSCSAPTAQNVLQQNQWKLEIAMDEYFTNRAAYPDIIPVKSGNKSKLEKIFDRYADPDDRSAMSAEGMMDFFRDVGIDPEGVVTLGIAWKLDFQEMGFFQRKEFVSGFAKLGADKISSIKKQVTEIQNDLQKPSDFKSFYKWLFDYVKGDKKKRTVAKEVAIHVFGTVFSERQYPLINAFSEFLTKHEDEFVNRDLWEQLLDFLKSHDASLSDYDADSGAWPVIFDEFVESQTAK